MIEWISVEDRMPCNCLTVLVAICPKMSMDMIETAYILNGEWDVIGQSGNAKDFITHWMPLPELPEAL